MPTESDSADVVTALVEQHEGDEHKDQLEDVAVDAVDADAGDDRRPSMLMLPCPCLHDQAM